MRIATLILVLIFMFGENTSSALEKKHNSEARQVVIVVVGAAGIDEYAVQFTESAKAWEDACAKVNLRFVAIGMDTAQDTSDLEQLEKLLEVESKEVVATMWVVLIGHGTYDGRDAKFNLRGPDVSADDLVKWLTPVARPTVVINTASSSAPFIKKLSGPERVIITATKSGFEHNYTRFGSYLAKAIIESEADLDKDGQTSLLEAFLMASHRVEDFYSAAGRLATEHALLDDNGDTLGTPADWFRGIRPVKKASDDASLDGYRAHQFHIVYSNEEAKMSPELRVKRDQLELEVFKLRDSKASYSDDEYFSKLEELLKDIAHIYEKADQGH